MKDERNYQDECGDHGGRNKQGDPCGRAAGWGTDYETGKCRNHRGTSPDGTSHEGNNWAAKHGAWSESFMSGFLTEKERNRVRDAMEVLDTPEGAQAQAKVAAVIALEQFRRTGDDRFLRRYESICDTFGIAPADELELSGELEHSGALDVSIQNTVVETDGDGE